MIVPEYGDLTLEALFVELDAGSAVDASAQAWAALERIRPQAASDTEAWARGPAARDPLRPGRFGLELLPDGLELPPREAWQIAHALAALLPRGRVEPAFRDSGRVPPLQAQTDAAQDEAVFGAGSGPPPPEDVTWHLERIHAPQARAWLQGQALVGGEAVHVGHPDTGYTEHPDIWSEQGPIVSALGRDLMDEDADARDPLDAGVLLQPGHGTATASVIAARPGISVQRLDGGSLADLVGVAPGAQIVPLRVTRTVIMFAWQRRLARAIEFAVDAGCRVISMSVGGIGGRRLERALELAESRGVIVVAAAGNNVGFVVAPAVYPTVVACAAIGPDGTPWSGSSHGKAVDISAPGHQVWVACWDGATAAARPGSGTSFATACVAGAAVLWLAAHQQALAGRSNQAASLFRQALAQTANGSPIADGFGAGLLDCLALVKQPLAADLREAVPLERNAKEAMLESLIGSPRARGVLLDDACASELAFHLTVDPELRQAWQASALTEGARAFDASPTSGLVPRYASARLRSNLRVASTPRPPPALARAASPIAASAPARAPCGAVEQTISILLEVRVRVITEGGP